jgi:uncharacterized protein (DUF169 family)
MDTCINDLIVCVPLKNQLSNKTNQEKQYNEIKQKIRNLKKLENEDLEVIKFFTEKQKLKIIKTYNEINKYLLETLNDATFHNSYK